MDALDGPSANYSHLHWGERVRVRGISCVRTGNDTGLLTLMRKLFTGNEKKKGEKYRKTIQLNLTNRDSCIFIDVLKAFPLICGNV